MEEPGQGPRLVRPGLVCRKPSATSPEPPGAEDAADGALDEVGAVNGRGLARLGVKENTEKVDIDQIRHEVEPFVKDAAALAIWSKEFFLDVHLPDQDRCK